MSLAYDLVIPATSPEGVGRLLAALDRGGAPRPAAIFVVDDRPVPESPMVTGHGNVGVIMCGGRGPAAARNLGWRAGESPWVVFLDDDVVPAPGWAQALGEDVAARDARVAAVAGTVRVPRSDDGPPTDWERQVLALERARWVTADMAVRREVLERLGGFDERFPRPYREDADLGLRIAEGGWSIAQGGRVTLHPIGRAGPWVSVRRQVGNRDDALMRRLHGADWRRRTGAGAGRLRAHAAVVAAALGGAVAAIARRRAPAAVLGLGATAGIAEFAWRRIEPGPRDAREVATMAVTSAAIPFAAVWHRTAATLRLLVRGPG